VVFCAEFLLLFDVDSSEDEDMSDDDSDDLSDKNDDDKDGERLKTARQVGPNGHRPVDHRPPEHLLKKAERKVARCIERKKVCRYNN